FNYCKAFSSRYGIFAGVFGNLQVVRQMCCPNYQPQWFDAVDVAQEEFMQREYGPAEEGTERKLPKLEYHSIKNSKDRSLRAWERGNFLDAITTLHGGNPLMPNCAVTSPACASLWDLPPGIAIDPAREAAADRRVRGRAGSDGRSEDSSRDEDDDDESEEWDVEDDRRTQHLLDDELLYDEGELCPGCGDPFESCRECPTCCVWVADPLAFHLDGWTQRGIDQTNPSSARSDSASDSDRETADSDSASESDVDFGSDSDSWETCFSHSFDSSSSPTTNESRCGGLRYPLGGGHQRTGQELQQRHHLHILQIRESALRSQVPEERKIPPEVEAKKLGSQGLRPKQSAG
ncbi:hypothetical protein BIW11_06486, partial [Tropilaelaps mercedesae]